MPLPAEPGHRFGYDLRRNRQVGKRPQAPRRDTPPQVLAEQIDPAPPAMPEVHRFRRWQVGGAGPHHRQHAAQPLDRRILLRRDGGQLTSRIRRVIDAYGGFQDRHRRQPAGLGGCCQSLSYSSCRR